MIPRHPPNLGCEAGPGRTGPAHRLLMVEYFTDPLCSWSWGFEPQWRRLRLELRDQLRWRYRMGGLIRDWQGYLDPLNSVSRPAQMAPQWIEVHHLTGMPLDPSLWLSDPPASSLPACLAFKAAEQQGPDLGEHYLRSLREAVMVRGRNISRTEVLIELAGQLREQTGDRFDVELFTQDMSAPKTKTAVLGDIRDAYESGITRFPTLRFTQGEIEPLVLTGYRPYSVLIGELQNRMEVTVLRTTDASSRNNLTSWGEPMPRELDELGNNQGHRAMQPARIPPHQEPR